MGNIKVYQCGDTVRLKCKFYNFENEPVNPDIVKLIIYNYKYEVLSSINVYENSGKIGEYHYDYATGKKEQKLYYEWNGEIDGSVSLIRDSFMTKFV